MFSDQSICSHFDEPSELGVGLMVRVGLVHKGSIWERVTGKVRGRANFRVYGSNAAAFNQ